MAGQAHSRDPRVRNTIMVMAGVLMAAALIAAQTAAPWVPPRPGWLYVVASDFKARVGQVLVVDPDAGNVVEALTRGYEPDIAVSPDGSRLFLAYNTSDDKRAVLQVIDTATGTVVHEQDDGDPWPTNGMAYKPRMALSADGRWLFHFKISDATPPRVYYVETFDTEQNVMLPETARLPLCGTGMLLPASARDKLYVVCPEGQEIHLLALNEQGGAASQRTPRVRAIGGGQFTREMATAFVGPDGDVVTVIKGDGRFMTADAASGRVVRQDVVDRAARRVSARPKDRPFGETRDPGARANGQDWLAGRQIWSQLPVRSPDGARLYLLTARGNDLRAVRDEVVVLDAKTLARVQTISLSRPCVNITLSADGSRLYGVDTPGGALLVLDADTGHELRVISGLGPRPVYAVVAP